MKAFYAFLEPKPNPAKPMTAMTMPATSIQMALSVGEPVKNREMLELNELVAPMPMTVRTTPATRSAIDMGLFIISINSTDLVLRP